MHGFVDAVTQHPNVDVLARIMPRAGHVQEEADGQVKRASVENFLLDHPRAVVPSFSRSAVLQGLSFVLVKGR